jgi:two-component system chemotaxis response regulator CheB
VLVVLHLPPTATSMLPRILSGNGPLPAKHAEDGERIEGGQIYVAPPGCHLLVADGHVSLDPGPMINGHRPAVDPLFQTAAHAHGRHVAGVVLSGVLDDGTLGLGAVKRHGGLTVVQDAGDALYPTMPERAREHVGPDLVLPAAEIGAALAATAVVPPPPRAPEKADIRTATLTEVDRGSSDQPQPGTPLGLTCPDCQGGIWEDDEDGVAVYRCRVGHAFSPETFVAAQNGRVETALWTALRALEERAALNRRLAGRLRGRGAGRGARSFEARADLTLEQAVVIRELLQVLERDASGIAEDDAA